MKQDKEGAETKNRKDKPMPLRKIFEEVNKYATLLSDSNKLDQLPKLLSYDAASGKTSFKKEFATKACIRAI